jgi:hypothetical protein
MASHHPTVILLLYYSVVQLLGQPDDDLVHCTAMQVLAAVKMQCGSQNVHIYI